MASGEATRREFVAAASGAAVATLIPGKAGAAARQGDCRPRRSTAPRASPMVCFAERLAWFTA